MANCMTIPPSMLNLVRTTVMPMPAAAGAVGSGTRRFCKPLYCAPLQQLQPEVDGRIMCEPCNGKGWLLCDFCKGQKTNVKADNKRIYRRCPSCRACRLVIFCVQIAKCSSVSPSQTVVTVKS
ncbi:uncharacterized protein LOC110410675 isoform X2 [Herrania umbratica]|uniref:Uncharacterized protein LOC110410675 isoform X2 n=1 Tax=Herrania umbratica TaxID=108875 RepID=A0A6J0ZN78_9ROSI|nr:uncharacterized protein LOC110410675 isoform X2 [Herrania umbratica]